MYISNKKVRRKKDGWPGERKMGQTDTSKDTHTDRQTDRQIDRQIDR